MEIKCLVCPTGLLEPFSGDFGTGVFHPDGGEETRYEEGWRCDRCGRAFSNEQLDEAYGPLDIAPENLVLLRVLHLK